MEGSEQISVGELARRLGTTVRTVRYYEQVGLLPATPRSEGGHRRYGPAHRERLLRILTLRDLGVPLERIGRIADGDDPDALIQVLAEHRTVLEERRAVLDDALARIHDMTGAADPGHSGTATPWTDESAFDLLEGISVSIALTRIYTRTGDDGSTGLATPARVAKTDARVEAIGAVDELCAAIGMALGRCSEGPVYDVLDRLQNELFDLGADLAVPRTADGIEENGIEDDGPTQPSPALRIGTEYVTRLEQDCDRFNAALPALRSFVLPGGSSPSGEIHFARAVCRRAERRAWHLPEAGPDVTRYLNRLSDLLFILARCTTDHGERLWQPARHEGSPQGASSGG